MAQTETMRPGALAHRSGDAGSRPESANSGQPSSLPLLASAGDKTIVPRSNSLKERFRRARDGWNGQSGSIRKLNFTFSFAIGIGDLQRSDVDVKPVQFVAKLVMWDTRPIFHPSIEHLMRRKLRRNEIADDRQHDVWMTEENIN